MLFSSSIESRLQEALALAQAPDLEVDDSKISDRDLEDPELLSQLARFEQGDFSVIIQHGDNDDAMDVDESPRSKAAEQENSDVLDKIKQLEAAIRRDKEVALRFKREGKMEDARKALLQMKGRQKQLEDLKILVGGADPEPASSGTALRAVAQPSPVRANTAQVSAAVPGARSPSPALTPTKTPPPARAAATPSPRGNPQSKLVHQRMLEYKKAILTAKDDGDVETAQTLFEYFKRLQQIQSDLSENIPVGSISLIFDKRCPEAFLNHLICSRPFRDSSFSSCGPVYFTTTLNHHSAPWGR